MESPLLIIVYFTLQKYFCIILLKLFIPPISIFIKSQGDFYMTLNKKTLLSKISIIIYVVILTIVFFFWFLFQGDESGGAAMMWALMIVPLSILPLIASIILALISLFWCMHDKIIKVKITKGRTIWCLINIIQLIITIVGIILLKNWFNA